MSNEDGSFNSHSDLDQLASAVIYDLRPGFYDVDVRVPEDCQGVESGYMKRYKVDAKDEKVIGMVVRSAADRSLDISELVGLEDPKKLSGGNSKIR